LYFRCSSTHLSEYLLTYEYNPKPDKILGKFFFLKHINLYLNIDNIKGNNGFYIIIIILALYFINFFIVKIFLSVKKKKLGNKNYILIGEFLIDYTYPYGNIEGDFFVNKNNLNKIYNNNLKLNKEKIENKPKEYKKKNKNILKLKTSIGTENKAINSEKYQRFNAYLNELNLMNFGDVRNRKIFEQYYNKINEKGYKNDIQKPNDVFRIKKEKITFQEEEDIYGPSSETK